MPDKKGQLFYQQYVTTMTFVLSKRLTALLIVRSCIAQTGMGGMEGPGAAHKGHAQRCMGDAAGPHAQAPAGMPQRLGYSCPGHAGEAAGSHRIRTHCCQVP